MANIKKVLLVEDDINLGNILKDFLVVKGYDCTLARDGVEGKTKFDKLSFDFIILDVMMPKKDGFTLAREIRNEDKGVPILFLTAKSMKEDTLEGFSSGCDDYMTKPFSMDELLARMNAIFRRLDKNTNHVYDYSIGALNYDPNSQILDSGKEKIRLTTKENHLLKLLVENKNQVLERANALQEVWGDDSYYNGRSMDVYITKLRKHLKQEKNVEILNVHGIGFRLQVS